MKAPLYTYLGEYPRTGHNGLHICLAWSWMLRLPSSILNLWDVKYKSRHMAYFIHCPHKVYNLLSRWQLDLQGCYLQGKPASTPPPLSAPLLMPFGLTPCQFQHLSWSFLHYRHCLPSTWQCFVLHIWKYTHDIPGAKNVWFFLKQRQFLPKI